MHLTKKQKKRYRRFLQRMGTLGSSRVRTVSDVFRILKSEKEIQLGDRLYHLFVRNGASVGEALMWKFAVKGKK